MTVSVVDLSANQKKLQVEIPAPIVQQELEKRYRDLAQKARIKGFRPGKVPKNILRSLYGKNIEGEVSTRFIQESYPEALREASIKPLAEADIDDLRFGDDGTFVYWAIVEVCPPFDLDGYENLELHRPVREVTEEQVQSHLEALRLQHAQLRGLETERPVEVGDVVLVALTPSVDGSPVEKAKSDDQMIEVGKNLIHPDFDKHLMGRHTGESFSFDLEFPQDSSPPEIAGKTVHFDVTIREVKEKVILELNDEFAQEVGRHETLEALVQEVRSNLEKQEKGRASQEVREQAIEKLLDRMRFDVSEKVIQREIDRLLEMFLQQFESQGMKIDTSRLKTPEVRESYRPQAEKNLRWTLIAHAIGEKENLLLTESEEDEIFREVARLARMDMQELKRDYANSPIIEQAKDSKLKEKVLNFIEEHATFGESSKEDNGGNQE